MEKQYYTYILTNSNHSTFYIGVTSNLSKRIYEHKNKLVDGFSKTYNLNKLVYFEIYSEIEEAIKREKKLKKWNKNWKKDLINKTNSEWKDLYSEII
jgi:putative endonuclease